MEQNKEKKARILVVDDVESSREILSDMIENMGYLTMTCADGEEALRVVEGFNPDIIITDMYMPVMGGIELCEQLKSNPITRDIPVIFESADGMDILQEGFKKGGIDYISKPFYPEIIKARIGLHLKLKKSQYEIAEVNRMLQVSVKEQLKQIEQEKKNVLYALTRVIKENSTYDEAHSERIAYDCKILAEALQLTREYAGDISDSFIETIEIAAPICDLGNVGIPDEFFTKERELSEEERAEVEKHTILGGKIVEDILQVEDNNEFLTMGYEIAANHHEYYNGCGYPSKKKGSEIPLSAQIVSVVSAYCAMTEKRPYREAYSPKEAAAMIHDMSGIKYTPQICDVLEMIVNQLH